MCRVVLLCVAMVRAPLAFVGHLVYVDNLITTNAVNG